MYKSLTCWSIKLVKTIYIDILTPKSECLSSLHEVAGAPINNTLNYKFNGNRSLLAFINKKLVA